MNTNKKPFSYHQQVARLRRAEELILQAMDEIAGCVDHEREHGHDTEEYDTLHVAAEVTRDSVENMRHAVEALAAHQEPDTVQASGIRLRELLLPIARRAGELGYTEQEFVDAARDAF